MSSFWRLEEPTANKVHKCNGGCKKDIEIGYTYIKIVNPVWLDYEGDVDEDGRNIGFLLPEDQRHWYVKRYHQECFDNTYYGI